MKSAVWQAIGTTVHLLVTRDDADMTRLVVDWVACDGHGLCAVLLPELVDLDEWGYPILDGEVPAHLQWHARRAVGACPALALRRTRP